MRYSAGTRTGAGSTTLPIISLYAGAALNPHIREIGVFNTTTSAVALKLVRLATAGTQGTGLAETSHESAGGTAACSAYGTHTGIPSIGGDLGYNTVLGAAIGAGVIWTFGTEMGLSIPAGTGNGIGVIVATGTGQVCDAYIVWDE